MEKVDYAIYPSLLDAYLRYKRNEDDETFISLFNRINKVEEEKPDHVLKGIQFEKTINSILKGEKVEVVDYPEIVGEITRRLANHTAMQKYEETIIDTPFGRVKLYGIFDFDFPDMTLDLKTVVDYKCNKYIKYLQHPVYSFIRHKNNRPIKAFKYLVTDFKFVYQETYIPNESMYQKMIFVLYEFITFINHFRKYITDKKIFGLE